MASAGVSFSIGVFCVDHLRLLQTKSTASDRRILLWHSLLESLSIYDKLMLI